MKRLILLVACGIALMGLFPVLHLRIPLHRLTSQSLTFNRRVDAGCASGRATPFSLGICP